MAKKVSRKASRTKSKTAKKAVKNPAKKASGKTVNKAEKTKKTAKKTGAGKVMAKAPKPAKPRKQAPSSGEAGKPNLLSGGNPQIAKGYGDAPVQAYIAAMPGWKSDMGRRLDALVTRTIPGVRKAVKWNSPFYGVEEHRYFLSFHVFTKYIKVAFFRGASLHPLPPGESRQSEVRYLDIHEEDRLDDTQFADWVTQASKLPGEKM